MLLLKNICYLYQQEQAPLGFEAGTSNLTPLQSDFGTVSESSAFLVVIFSPASLLILLHSLNMEVPRYDYYTLAVLSGRLRSYNHGVQGLDLDF